MTRLVKVTDFDDWRAAARDALRQECAPHDISFTSDLTQTTLFGGGKDGEDRPPEGSTRRRRIPPAFLDTARRVSCHSDPRRFDLLYRVLWRLTHGEGHVLELATDDDVREMNRFEKSVQRDSHKMKAFVRFRRVKIDQQEHYVAWHRPDHRVVRLTAPFFARRFPTMNWAIFTPWESALWDQAELTFGDGLPRSQAPQHDELDDLWRTYYASIFNPARVKVGAMVREMPRRYWSTMPETQLIPDLLYAAQNRANGMTDSTPAEPMLDRLSGIESLVELSAAAQGCRGCDLCRHATQTVFGEGPADARIVLIGEQPGDEEDRQGRPFVGPAGQVLNNALEAAGLERSEIYLTNAVKHFKFVQRGKHRLHKKPASREINACSPWLARELELVRPAVIVCLGATAAQAVIGRRFRLTEQRGDWVATEFCDRTIATYHPSAVLRARDQEHRQHLINSLIQDLRTAAQAAG